MIAGLLICFGYAVLVWLVFFRFRWLKFSVGWGVVSAFVGLHLLLIFLIGLRFVTPLASDARMIQHTIQLVPRLQGPTMVEAVLVEPNVPVKKGQPLFRLDRTIAEAKVRTLTAQLAAAKQNVRVLDADVAAAAQVTLLKDQLDYALYQQKITADLVKEGAERKEDVEKWDTRVATAKAALAKGQADERVARLKYQSEIDGVNTTVAATGSTPSPVDSVTRVKAELARTFPNRRLLHAGGRRLLGRSLHHSAPARPPTAHRQCFCT